MSKIVLINSGAHFLITSIFKSLYLLKWYPIFDTSPLTPFSKFNNFLWVCLFLGKNLSNFVPPAWKLHNPYCHNGNPSPAQLKSAIGQISFKLYSIENYKSPWFPGKWWQVYSQPFKNLTLKPNWTECLNLCQLCPWHIMELW